MDDLISRQAAIEAFEGELYSLSLFEKVQNLPPAQPEPCDLCSNLEKGDTLYQSSDWDGGIGFDYIWDIRFCPKCGRSLE